MITQEILKELIHYDKNNGIFTWLKRDFRYFKTKRAHSTWNSRFAGKDAGTVCNDGYISIIVLNRPHKAHRLAFLYMTGNLPLKHVDHINQNKVDNRWENLRPVSPQVNSKNMPIRSDNKSGIVGVCWNKSRNKWSTEIFCGGKKYFLGYFTNIKDAEHVRKSAEIAHGFHENHGTTKICELISC